MTQSRARGTVRTERTGWTAQLVAERLAEAADVLSRLPDDRVGGFYDFWPRLVGAANRGSVPAAPAPEAIDRLDEVLGGLSWLDHDERRLVWLRAQGLPWKRITHRLGIGRTTAWQRWTAALLKILVRLDAQAEQECSNNKRLNKRWSSVLKDL